MTRVKAIYRSWAIPCSGKQVYAPRHRVEWLGKISEAGVRRRAEFYYQQLDALRTVRQQVRRDLLAEGKKHQAWKRLCQIPSISDNPKKLWATTPWFGFFLSAVFIASSRRSLSVSKPTKQNGGHS